MGCCLFKKKKVSGDKGSIKDDHLREKELLKEPKGPSDYRVWIPGAENIYETEGVKMRTRGDYDEGYPKGLVVHFNAGWSLKRGHWWDRKDYRTEARKYALRTANGGVKHGYNFLVMDVYGKIYQSRPLNKHGYHCGTSAWNHMRSLNNKFAGIEIHSPGRLKFENDAWKTWFDYEIPESYRRYVDGTDDRPKGNYVMYTPTQERELLNLCRWMEENSPKDSMGGKIFKILNICGHHECSPGRKNDPGGALSVSMSKWRDMV